MSKYAEEFKYENKELPQLRDLIEASVEPGLLTDEQVDTIYKNVGKLITELVPELVYIEMSDSFLFETGFEECTKQFYINLDKIGVNKKSFDIFKSPNFENNLRLFLEKSGQLPKE